MYTNVKTVLVILSSLIYRERIQNNSKARMKDLARANKNQYHTRLCRAHPTVTAKYVCPILHTNWWYRDYVKGSKKQEPFFLENSFCHSLADRQSYHNLFFKHKVNTKKKKVRSKDRITILPTWKKPLKPFQNDSSSSYGHRCSFLPLAIDGS